MAAPSEACAAVLRFATRCGELMVRQGARQTGRIGNIVIHRRWDRDGAQRPRHCAQNLCAHSAAYFPRPDIAYGSRTAICARSC
jgi:hypothetical protein